jgi:hypothetical protein
MLSSVYELLQIKQLYNDSQTTSTIYVVIYETQLLLTWRPVRRRLFTQTCGQADFCCCLYIKAVKGPLEAPVSLVEKRKPV